MILHRLCLAIFTLMYAAVAHADDAPGAAGRAVSEYHADLRKVANALLDQLKIAPDPSAALALEQRIWDTWMRSGEPEIDALMQQGATAMRVGAVDIALAMFDAVIARRSEYAEGWNKRATVHYMMGNLDASLADVSRVLTLEPRHFGALAGIGLISIAKGDRQAALAAYRRVLEVSPQNPGAKESVEVLLEQLKGDPT